VLREAAGFCFAADSAASIYSRRWLTRCGQRPGGFRSFDLRRSSRWGTLFQHYAGCVPATINCFEPRMHWPGS
jgi:hypothetical protein